VLVKALQIEWAAVGSFSQVKGRVRHVFDDEAHLAQAADDQITLVLVYGQSCKDMYMATGHTNAEVALEVNHLVLDQLGLEHGDGGLLERVSGATIEVATARADAGMNQC
jgi:hypothetical protein